MKKKKRVSKKRFYNNCLGLESLNHFPSFKYSPQLFLLFLLMYNDRIVLHTPGNILSYLRSMYPSINIIKFKIKDFFPEIFASFPNNVDCDKFPEIFFFFCPHRHTYLLRTFCNLGWECVWLERSEECMDSIVLNIFLMEKRNTFLCENLAFTFLSAGLVVNKVGIGGILLSVARLLPAS